MQQEPHLLIIHGATASSNTFNYLLACGNFKSVIPINYDSHQSFKNNLQIISSQIDPDIPCFVVAHSLGGIYAVHLYKTHNIVGAVTAGTPYGGSDSALILSWLMPHVQLFKDINPYSPPITQSRNVLINVPWIQLVSTRGHKLWSMEPNDGVVTYRSMTCRSDVQHIYLNYTHHEIMQSPELVEIVLTQYKKIY